MKPSPLSFFPCLRFFVSVTSLCLCLVSSVLLFILLFALLISLYSVKLWWNTLEVNLSHSSLSKEWPWCSSHTVWVYCIASVCDSLHISVCVCVCVFLCLCNHWIVKPRVSALSSGGSFFIFFLIPRSDNSVWERRHCTTSRDGQGRGTGRYHLDKTNCQLPSRSSDRLDKIQRDCALVCMCWRFCAFFIFVCVTVAAKKV